MAKAHFYESGSPLIDKIIQIIPAPPDMWAEYSDTEEPDARFSRVVCLALIEDSYGSHVVPMACGQEDGEIFNALDFTYFCGIVFAKDPRKEATE